MKLGTLFGIYYCVEMVRIEKKSHMLEFRAKFFKTFFSLSRIKQFKHDFYGMKLGTQHYLVRIIVLKGLEKKTIFIYLKLHAKLRFYRF